LVKQEKIDERIPTKLPPNVIVAHRTGLERNVCYDIGLVFTEKGDFLISVLTKCQGKAREVKELIANLSYLVNSYYQSF